MLKIQCSLVLAVLCLIPVVGEAESFRYEAGTSRLNFRSEESVNIYLTAMDYRSGWIGSEQTNTAENIEITVSSSNLGSGSKVRAVITPNCWSKTYGWKIEKSSLFTDLVFSSNGAETHFSGKFSEVVMTHFAVHGGQVINCFPEVSLVIDGVWQTDPINKTHNFKMINF